MSGKRITIRRGVGKSNTGLRAEEEMSAFARAVQAATPSVAQATASLEAFGRTILNTAFRNPGGAVDGPSRPPPAPAEGTPTGRMSSSSPNMSNAPRSDVMRQMLVGVDPASGQDVTGSYLVPTGAVDASISALSLHDSVNMDSVSDTLAREISRRLAVGLDNDMMTGSTASARVRERGAPSLEVSRRYETMETEIALRVFLRGPSSPPSYSYARFRDEEFRNWEVTATDTLEIREEIVRRLLAGLTGGIRQMIVETLENAMMNDVGTRNEMGRMLRGRR